MGTRTTLDSWRQRWSSCGGRLPCIERERRNIPRERSVSSTTRCKNECSPQDEAGDSFIKSWRFYALVRWFSCDPDLWLFSFMLSNRLEQMVYHLSSCYIQRGCNCYSGQYMRIQQDLVFSPSIKKKCGNPSGESNGINKRILRNTSTQSTNKCTIHCLFVYLARDVCRYLTTLWTNNQPSAWYVVGIMKWGSFMQCWSSINQPISMNRFPFLTGVWTLLSNIKCKEPLWTILKPS